MGFIRQALAYFVGSASAQELPIGFAVEILFTGLFAFPLELFPSLFMFRRGFF